VTLTVSRPRLSPALVTALQVLEQVSFFSGVMSKPYPIQATGAVITPVLNSSPPQAGSCGVTFVSPNYAFTAAHCPDQLNIRPEIDPVTVQMFSPTVAFHLNWAAQPLTGTFPNYAPRFFGAAEGYHVDEYQCVVVARCGSEWGNHNCTDPAASGLDGDLALLKCQGGPGNKYGYVNVAQQDVPLADVFVPWKHEVYDVPLDEQAAGDAWDHYIRLTADIDQNFHYLAGRNQLLPLASTDYPGAISPRKIATPAVTAPVRTDVPVCHGGSGSGVFQKNPNGTDRTSWELLGPAVTGDTEINAGFLCAHAPQLDDGTPRQPGELGSSYSPLYQTQYLFNSFIGDIQQDCRDNLLAPASGLFKELIQAVISAIQCNALFPSVPWEPKPVQSGTSPWDNDIVTVKAPQPVEVSGSNWWPEEGTAWRSRVAGRAAPSKSARTPGSGPSSAAP